MTGIRRPLTGVGLAPAALARPGRQAWAAAALYLVATVVLFGRGLLAHMGSQCLCVGSTHDEGLVAWGLAWWPHALLHGLNPFVPKLIYAPEGIDIAHGTMMPGLAFLLWPVTALAGPLFAFNLAALLAPALAAFFAFLLCRRLTGAFAASLLGGWLFGFSTYLLGQETGHLNLTLVFLVPALVHLGLRLYAGELRHRSGLAVITLALVGQFSLSDEIFATCTLFAVIALAVAWALGDRRIRSAVAAMLAPLALAYALTAVIVSPYLYYALKPGAEPVLPARTGQFSADLLSFVVPTQITRVLGLHFLATTAHFTAGWVEGGAYLGLPLIALVAVGLWRGRRRFGLRLLGAMLVVTLVFSLGAHLHVDGATRVPLPWDLIDRLPLFGIVLPSRLVMYTTLVVAIVAALALSELRAAWVLALASVVTLWPAVELPLWRSRPDLPRLFATTAYRKVLRPTDTALLLPIGIYGDGMLWQAEAGFSFRMAGGYVVPPEAPDPYKSWAIYPTLAYDSVGPDVEQDAARFIAAHHVTVAVLSLLGIRFSPWPRILGELGWSGTVDAGTLVLRPARRAPLAVKQGGA